MNHEDKLRKAYKDANAIVALEGWEPTPEALAIQERVIKGELTHDEAVQAHIKAVLASTPAAKPRA
jgi:hypothetical protein